MQNALVELEPPTYPLRNPNGSATCLASGLLEELPGDGREETADVRGESFLALTVDTKHLPIRPYVSDMQSKRVYGEMQPMPAAQRRICRYILVI